MSGATVAEFIAYWQGEGEAYVRRGDYEWMASLVPGQRLEARLAGDRIELVPVQPMAAMRGLFAGIDTEVPADDPDHHASRS